MNNEKMGAARMSDAYRPEAGERSFECAECGTAQSWLAAFPGGRCIDCHAASAEGRRMWTAAELRQAWGGR